MKQNLLGLIGENTSYSLSPFLHNTSGVLLGLRPFYKGYSLKGEELEGFLESFKQEGGCGLNVTNPFKKKAAALTASQELSSVNTLKLVRGVWEGYSTDGEGFWKAFTRYEKTPDQYEAFCFLGTGDVLPSLLKFIKDKTFEKPFYFLRRNGKNDSSLKTLYPNSSFLSFSPESLKGVLDKYKGKKICLVQATSAPSCGDDLSSFIPTLKNFDGFFHELLYSGKSKIYDHLKSRNFPVLDGLPMLIEQALLSQKIWWGLSVSYEVLFEELRKRKPKGVSFE